MSRIRADLRDLSFDLIECSLLMLTGVVVAALAITLELDPRDDAQKFPIK